MGKKWPKHLLKSELGDKKKKNSQGLKFFVFLVHGNNSKKYNKISEC